MKTEKLRTFFVSILSALLIMLGIAVMCAWHFRWSSVLQIDSNYVAMQFNTALCVCLSGIALLTASRGGIARNISISCAAVMGFFASVALLQYIFNSSWGGLDRLFVEPYIITKSFYPGRMAPNTAFCFILHSLSLLLWHFAKKSEFRLFVIAFPDTIVLLLSFFAFTGYFIKTEIIFSWWGGGHIALHTAFGLLVSSIAFLVLALERNQIVMQRIFLQKQPVLIAILGIGITITIAQNIFVSVQRNAAHIAELNMKRTAQIVEIQVENDLSSLMRMRGRLEKDRLSVEEWEGGARALIRNNLAHSMMLSDHNLHTVKTVPEDLAALWDRPLSRDIIEAAQKDRDTSFIRLMNDPGMASLLMIGLPVYDGEKFRGFLLSAYDVENKIKSILEQDEQNYTLSLSGENGVLYFKGQERKYPWEIKKEYRANILGHEWVFNFVADATPYRDNGLILLILVAGTALSFLLAFTTWQNNKIRHYADNLKKRDEQYAFALDAAGMGLWDWDKAGNNIDWKANTWRIFGAKSNEEITKNALEAREMIPPEELAEVDRQMAESLAANQGFSIEYPVMRLDGTEAWVQSRGKAVVFDEHGNAQRISGTLMDITERKLKEQELLRSNQELEKFAYVASHDLKAPLRNIDDLAKWIIEDHEELLPSEARKKLDLLRGRVGDLETLLDDILAYSRAGRISDNPVEVDIQEILDRLIQIHVPESFKVEIVGKPPVFRSPRTPLEQIFGNLLSNAVKHHDRDTGTIRIGIRDTGKFYEFSVVDDGPGILPEFHERVFQMFQTLQSRDRVSGSGLGMAIVKKLVEWRGGRIWIVSGGKGRGTGIYFLWPTNAK